MRLHGIEEKVEFLSKPKAYPGRVERVETRETHMSWIFLTDTQAWKLKKPVRTEYLNFSTVDARRGNCEREVRLNRRLARDVYQGVVGLTVSKQGNLQLGGKGELIDWLVCMRRLPSDRMLDEVVARHRVSEKDLAGLASVLVTFYKKALPVWISGLQYRNRLAEHLQSARSQLVERDYAVPSRLAESIVNAQLEFLAQNPSLFDERIVAGKLIEAHGDLRPEHICLERVPVIIDCLEFNRNLRILDVASELTFLALECERLGAPEIGEFIFDKYSEETGDTPSRRLVEFYKSYHACVRAKIAVMHLKDASTRDRPRWTAKANQYLEIVSGSCMAA